MSFFFLSSIYPNILWKLETIKTHQNFIEAQVFYILDKIEKGIDNIDQQTPIPKYKATSPPTPNTNYQNERFTWKECI